MEVINFKPNMKENKFNSEIRNSLRIRYISLKYVHFANQILKIRKQLSRENL